MRLRALAAGIAAVAWGSGLAAASPSPPAPAPSGATHLESFPTFTTRAGIFVPPRSSESSDESVIESPSGTDVAREAAIAGAAIGAGFLLDKVVKPGDNNHTFAFKLGRAIGGPYVLVPGLALFAIQGWATDNEDNLRVAARLGLSMLATTATVEALKALFHRERPDKTDRQSFPSGHAANTFAIATVLDREYHGAVPWIGYGVATFVSATRVYGCRHWISDVTTGAVVGRFYGRLTTEEAEGE